jgi:hypothetical protein
MERRFGFDKITNLIGSDVGPDSPGTRGDCESVRDVALRRIERYRKLMSDWGEMREYGRW